MPQVRVVSNANFVQIVQGHPRDVGRQILPQEELPVDRVRHTGVRKSSVSRRRDRARFSPSDRGASRPRLDAGGVNYVGRGGAAAADIRVPAPELRRSSQEPNGRHIAQVRRGRRHHARRGALHGDGEGQEGADRRRRGRLGPGGAHPLRLRLLRQLHVAVAGPRLQDVPRRPARSAARSFLRRVAAATRIVRGDGRARRSRPPRDSARDSSEETGSRPPRAPGTR